MKKFNFDKKKAQKAITLLLESFGEDLEREGLRRTPERVAEFYKEALSGNEVDPSELVPVHYASEEHEEIILVKDIPFYSLCEHHLLPFFGKACVAYMPQKDKIVGVSKLVRLVEVFANRLQLQERLTKQVADTIMKSIEPHGVMVVIEAEHLCMTMRGVKKPGAKMLTSAMRGIFLKDVRTRSEAMSLLGR
ncbi:GTP cyclohydrolase I FolE [Candidatus Endomicrobiellum devescovinae]|uniref:GTP cyclohydrolase I FolE n=1 Tax=Candidatus Endomicrobiellum devescovinae TaxID=3242322 RepID=UPI002829B507|nr:GTP cyclohydrolase I FolE [Endomicrobium sp.]MDR1434156.1 GTP cyclohydrolase I FolE [Endomicrobium sp.]MDR2817876.1 GTP cyclohydrolase I FolE [Endomicrobium sp.]